MLLALSIRGGAALLEQSFEYHNLSNKYFSVESIRLKLRVTKF